MESNVKRKNIIKFIAMPCIAILIICFGASFFMLHYALTPQHRGLNIEESYTEMYNRYPFLEQWVDSLNQEKALKDTVLINKEGKKLHAFYIDAPQPTSKTAIIVHGYTDNAIRMFMIGYLYNRDLAYNVLLPDLQFHGKSEGKAIQMGWKDRLDIMEWIDLAIQKYGSSTSLVVHGISMGAATTMMLSGEEQPAHVKCYIEDCGYTSVWDEFSQEINVRFSLPSFPLIPLTSWLCQQIYGWSFDEASALNAVKKCKEPMLFIHGDEDTFVPTWMVYPLFEAKPEPKELWIVPGVEHAKSYLHFKEEYTQQVANFLSTHME